MKNQASAREAWGEEQMVQSLLAAYRQGFFPMAEPSLGPAAPLFWLSPEIRGVIPLTEPKPTKEEGFHVPRRLQKVLRRKPSLFEVTSDEAFEAVIRACGQPRWYEDESWIDERIIRLYCLLHERRLAHSVEVWRRAGEEVEKRVLVGGLYGVKIGGAFFAESKFCRPDLGGSGASKVALVSLVQQLRAGGFTLLDVQMWNDHLDQFGCRQIPRPEYLKMLKEAIAGEGSWGQGVGGIGLQARMLS